MRALLIASVLPLLVGCRAPVDVPSPSLGARDNRLGVVVVNRTQQPIAPAWGFVIPPCEEFYFDPEAAHEVSRRKTSFDWPGGDGQGNPLPPVGRLGPFIDRADELWFLLVTSVADPQYFYDATVLPIAEGADQVGKPKPAEWPGCGGKARLGTVRAPLMIAGG